MPTRLHKYDKQAYSNIMPNPERRFRKAFFYVEKLMEIDSEFKKTLTQINRSKKSNQLTEQQAQQQTNQAITKAIQRQSN